MRGNLALAVSVLLADPLAPGAAPTGADPVELLERGEDLLAVSAGSLAVAAARAALAAAEAESDVEAEIAAHALLGAALDAQGERERAQAAYAQAEELAEESGSLTGRAIVLIRRAGGFWQRADYARASADGERALALGEEARDQALVARALATLGQCDAKRGAYDAAVARFGRALAMAELAGDRALQARIEEHLAYVDLDRRRFADSFAHSLRALDLHESRDSVAGQARVLEDLAVLHLFQGDAESALEAAERSLGLATGVGGDPASEALARQARAGGLRLLGRLDEGRVELERALELRREIGDRSEAAWLLARLGRLESDLDRPAAALARYRAAIELWTSLEEWRPVAWYLLEEARASERLGLDDAARVLYRSAIELAERIDLPYKSIALGGLARLEARTGDRAAALLDGRRAVEAAHRTGNLAMIWNALSDLAEVELAFGLRGEALDHLRAALAAIEALRSEALPSDRSKRAEAADRQRVFSRTIGLLVDLGQTAEALEVAERAKARASLDLFASAGAREASQIAAELERAGAEAVPSPRVASVPPTPLLIDEVRRRRVTAVEYFAGDGRLFTWVIAADGTLHSRAAPLSLGDLETFVRAARDSRDPAPALVELHRRLIEPISEWLPLDPAETVIFVPHDRLFLVSFAALRDDSGRYLAERHAIAYTPSLALLAWSGRGPRAPLDEAPSLVVGNPRMPALRPGGQPLPALAEAELEAHAVASALGRRTELLVGEAAKESTVRERAALAPMIHLATHARLDGADPLASLVALAPDGAAAGQDGRWTVGEIQSARLAASLVTLSACDTGLGPISADGVLGLSRAFLVAGARSLVVSLWRVADLPTRFQMERFYGALARNGGDRAGALREAQLATLAALRRGDLVAPSGRPIADSPAHWAAFVLVGEPR